jgi:single-strand DNA-binding protein
MSINRVCLSGNLTSDPELRTSSAGLQILKMRLAVNDRSKHPETGEWTERANYVDLVMFGNRAEALSRFLSRGTPIAVDGKIHWSEWETDNGKRSKIEIHVDSLEFYGNRE